MTTVAAPAATITSPNQPRYPALDGLRAIAALMVFGQHYAASRIYVFGWGWTGVDIFFVLSGFLITGILYDSQDQPHRFRDFYIRRTLRIFPVYYAVWLAILVAAPIAQWQWDWRWLLWPVYLGNFARLLPAHSALDPGMIAVGPRLQHWFGGPMDLQIAHFWSLCVEEQFYLIWPFVVYRVRRRATLIRICIAVIAAMPLLRWLLTALVSGHIQERTTLYMILPTRLDGLLAGAIVALWLRGPERGWLSRWRRFALPAAGVVLATAYYVPVHLTHYSVQGTQTDWILYGFTGIALFAAAMVVDCIHPGGLLTNLLCLKPLRALGQISYGFYVYHELFRDFYVWLARRFFPGEVFAATIALAFFSTLAIATLSYSILERPMLRLKDRVTWQVHTAPVT